MEFGRIAPNQLKKADLKLPEDPKENLKVLKGKRKKDLKVYLGCAKWGRKEWIGKIYPKGTKEKEFLDHYVQHYNSIELNATHYKIYPPSTIEKWAVKGRGKDFKFCPKVAKNISHFGSLTNKQLQTDKFLEGVLTFGDNLGPIFLQLHDRFSPNRKDELFQFLKSLPKDLSFFVEVRHPEWFSDLSIRKEFFDTLRSLKIGAVITDAAGRRDCCHMHLTTPTTFIRFVGNSLHESDYSRCKDWVKRIKYWIDHGIREVYFFMHMHDEAKSPELTAYLVDLLNASCGLKIITPDLIKKKKPPGKGLKR